VPLSVTQQNRHTQLARDDCYGYAAVTIHPRLILVLVNFYIMNKDLLCVDLKFYSARAVE
jgi:hypothetical protein